MILDCTSYESTKTSLARIFNTTEDNLISILRSFNPFDDIHQSPEDALYGYVCNIFGNQNNEISVLWFHGSRVENHELFYKHGILPKSEAKKFIEPRLKEMSKGLVSNGRNPFSMSLLGKNGPHDEGPFAFLFKDIAIQAPRPNHNYCDAPEMVEDIAGILLGENYMDLVNRFKEVSKPCIVSFLSKSKGYELSHALLYLKLIEDGYSDLEAAAGSNTFFNSEGVLVHPERIQSVELIKNI